MRRHDIAILGLLFVLPLMMFWQQTIGGKTLLPIENLYQYEPFATYREVVQAPTLPHNALLSDLILQNYQWKAFTRTQFSQGEIPLWNPHNFSGTPFMAAGQQSILYPFSLTYYILPLTAAYGWFTILNLGAAGAFMYLFTRGIGISRLGGTLAGITYQLCGMFIASAVHPMIIGGVVWLPLILLMVEYIIRQRPLFGKPASAPWVLIGAAALACNILAGHAEITIYTLLITAYYSAARLFMQLWQNRDFRHFIQRSVWIGALIVLGLGLGAVQLVPLYDFVRTNWRAERSDLDTVLGYAHPWRDLIQFIIPNFYGSPAHHTYFDLFSGQTREVNFTNLSGVLRTDTDWGMKNYVEAALYLGILPLTLAGFSLITGLRKRTPQIIIFALLALISFTFMFGMKTYALIYVLPGINQLNTAFRWIFGVTVSVAVLAGFGADLVTQHPKSARRFGFFLVTVGGLVLAGLLLSRVLYPQIEPLIVRLLDSLAKANDAFESPAMFYSYQFFNVLIFGIMTVGSGIVFLWARGHTVAKVFAVTLVAADLLIASWGFNPASDPLLLDFTPPSIQWLQDQPGQWRYIVINDGAHRDILPANMTLHYGLNDVTGYDSIISKQYVDYMWQISPQKLLDHNRIAPLYTWDDYNQIVVSPQLIRLNVRYAITHKTTALTTGTLVYEDEAVRIWDIGGSAFAYTLTDISNSVLPLEIDPSNVQILSNTGREIMLNVTVNQSSWLVVSQSYAPGWKAFIRPQNAGENQEQELPVELVYENFQGIQLTEPGAWTIRLIYSPTSFQVGVFGTIISAAILLLLIGTWFWRLFVARQDGSEGSTASRLARNSIAPILLNLFNRSIDLVFASVMFRVLGVENAGNYYYAIAVFGWFDIITNFGLDIYLMREAGRHRDRAGYFFYNTSALRFSLVVACIPLALAFVLIRQSAADPLNAEVLLTIALFYVGLVPGSLSKGLTSLFYAFERAEYPAAVTTITTLCRVTFGLLVLLLGFGIIGLAGVSIVTNLITLGVLFTAGRRLITHTERIRVESGLIQGVVRQSFPLMLNHLLATIFFQIDIVILEWARGATSVGLYRVAYSWLLAINVIPAFFTQALMPIMSRQWQANPDQLKRTYTLSIKLLTCIAFPTAVIFTFTAELLTHILGGSAYLPDGAIALQIMIWSIPIGWMNSLTQYALVAVDLQQRITRAFMIAVAFNLISNIVLIPAFGYRAAALTTIASEAVLFIAFALLLSTALGKLDWFDMLWRQAVAATVMLLAILGLWSVQNLVALIVGIVLYPVVLFALRPLSSDEQTFLMEHIPARLNRWLPAK